MEKKVLFAGYEFEQKIQRGIYLYTKSLIRAVKDNEYTTGILTQMPAGEIDAIIPINAYKSLVDPTKLPFLSSRKRLIKQFIKYRLGFISEQIAKNKVILTESPFFYLQNIDFFINVPAIYRMAALSQKLPLSMSALTCNLKNMSNSDILFTTSPLNIKSQKCKLIQTIHDLIPMQVVVHGESSSNFYKRLIACNQSDKLLAVSQYTKDQFVDYFPSSESKIQVVYQPIPTDEHTIYLSSLEVIQKSVLRKYGLKQGQYTYYVGAVEARKNIHRLIESYRIATNNDPSIPLVISGSIDEGYVKEYNLYNYLQPITESSFKENIKYKQTSLFRKKKRTCDVINIFKTDYVTELEKLCLIRNARAFLFPTLNEGFGIPVLEAQTLGTPVLTTNCSSIPEVVGDTAYLIDDPFNIEEIACGIQRLLEDDDLCQNLSERGLKNAVRFSKENFKKNINKFLQDI